MAIDILSRDGLAPIVITDQEWLMRILGFYRTPDGTCLEILDPDGDPIMVPLGEGTRAATALATTAYFTVISLEDEFVSAVEAPVNSALIEGTYRNLDEMKAHATRMTSRDFVLELVDLASVGKPFTT